jgi:multiple sugar transport system permease protein
MHMDKPIAVSRHQSRITPYLMTGPAFVLLLLLIILPTVLVVGTAFTDWQLGNGPAKFVGLDTFRALLADPDFRPAAANTGWYVLVVATGTTLAGLAAALLVNGCRQGRAIYRAVFFMPTVATLTSMAIAWQILLSPSVGLATQFLRALGLAPPNWLQDPAFALPTLAVIGIWSGFGFAMMFFLAELKKIPRELYESNRLDNGGFADGLRHVTLPHLFPILLFVLVFSTMQALRVFDTVAVTTHGGPQKSTLVMLYFIYQEGFSLFRTNVAAAATALFIIVAVLLSLAQISLGRMGKAK